MKMNDASSHDSMKKAGAAILTSFLVLLGPMAVSQETRSAAEPAYVQPAELPDEPAHDVVGLDDGARLTAEPESVPGWTDVGATESSDGLRLFSNSSPAIWITPEGKVGVGKSNPYVPFHVFTTEGSRVALFDLRTTIPTDLIQYDIALNSESWQNVEAGVVNSGYVMGINTSGYLTGAGTVKYSYGIRSIAGTYTTSSGRVNSAYGGIFRVINLGQANGSVIDTGMGVYITDVEATTGFGIYQAGSNDRNYFAGNVGIGTSGPGQRLEVVGGNIAVDSGSRKIGYFGVPVGGGTNTGYLVPYDANGFTVIGNERFNGGIILRTGGTAAERVRVTTGGDVGLGTSTPAAKLHVAGDGIFTGTITGGNIQAKYQDVAEWVPTTESLAPGTVVVIEASAMNHVVASSRAYDTGVAGVISAQPGLVLGEGGDGKTMVATTGRVRIKADATANPIEPGDILVTSDKPGTAMKSVPVDVAGIQIHRPGTVVGKALEALPDGEGEILVLLSLQ
jgi:hypothetical protein